jgi:hypothetical protein
MKPPLKLPAGCGWCVQTVAKIIGHGGTYLGLEARRLYLIFTKKASSHLNC